MEMSTEATGPRAIVTLPTDTLHSDVTPLENQVGVAVLAALLPIIITSVLIGVYLGVIGPEAEVTQAVSTVAYGLAAVVVLGGVYVVLDTDELEAAMPLEYPDRTELLWTVICLPLAIGAFILGVTVGELLGFELAGINYSLADPVTLAAIIFGAIIVVPFVEEVLYRGLLLGSLMGRGVSPATAGGLTILLFAAVHVISLGVAGVIAIACWAIFPTFLRLKFNNVTGAWLLHLLNNIYAYLIVVALGLA